VKILYVTHQFLPDYVAGTEVLTWQTAREFGRRRHDVFVFTGFKATSALECRTPCDYYEYDDIPIYRVLYYPGSTPGLQNPMRDEYLNPVAYDCFTKAINAIKPDIVHCYHLHRLSVTMVDLCRRLSIPVVFTATDYWMLCPTCQLLLKNGSLCKGPDRHMTNCLKHMAALAGKSKILSKMPDWLLSILMKMVKSDLLITKGYGPLVDALLKRPRTIREAMDMVDRILVPTDFMKQLLSGFGIETGKIIQIPFGVQYQPVSAVSEAKGQQLRIGFIGTLYDHKGAHVLCEAIRLVPRDLSLTVRIYGSEKLFPDYVKKLKQIVKDDSRICFAGTFPPDWLQNILCDLDVLIVPSLWYENTPLVIHCAQAARVPVVASDLEGLNELVIDGENGFLFERGNPEQLAKIIERLCLDRHLVANMSKKTKPPMSMTAYGDRLEKIYGEIL